MKDKGPVKTEYFFPSGFGMRFRYIFPIVIDLSHRERVHGCFSIRERVPQDVCGIYNINFYNIELRPERNRMFNIIPVLSKEWALELNLVPHLILSGKRNIIQLSTTNGTNKIDYAIFQEKG